VFRVNRAWSRDANVDGNIARFINHSCTPNCGFEVVDKRFGSRPRETSAAAKSSRTTTNRSASARFRAVAGLAAAPDCELRG
jgi:hypothetical protein